MGGACKLQVVRAQILLGALGVIAGCGGSSNNRALSVEIRGFSARASALVLKVEPSPTFLCPDENNLSEVKNLPAATEYRWERTAAQPRAFTIPPTAEESVGISAYSEGSDGAFLQGACVIVSFEEIANIEGGRIVITLSQRR